ncbi:hypothetical protein HYH03_015389 [Edaphochlamys debaryana]|uniref:Uncharacterized protein n=1 Tax=Edaphochlamys debaryana TaxID=47281 RepID=A0A835XS51_9CHLO|nr:hypothetical protein HYH03_015389 [Edaphochlamys debaryana]|eukprot:KAG2485945.1 hypothetical protein HYH03_015389 [Edaphochlamys debaryana]
MRQIIGSGASVLHLAQNPGGRTEAEVLADLEQANEHLRKRKVLDHLHNLRGKAIEPLFCDFRSSLQLNLSAQHKPLVEGCHNFF